MVSCRVHAVKTYTGTDFMNCLEKKKCSSNLNYTELIILKNISTSNIDDLKFKHT